MERPSGISMIQVLIIILIIAVLGAGIFMLVRQERAQTRDAKRMADMARLSAAFFEMYATEGSYTPAATGCATEGSSPATCALTKYFPDITTLKDPGGSSYKVIGVPGEASYVVSFRLERSYGTYVAGTHALTPEGIK
jgi:type II secretory pathway pseudopilin PulG